MRCVLGAKAGEPYVGPCLDATCDMFMNHTCHGDSFCSRTDNSTIIKESTLIFLSTTPELLPDIRCLKEYLDRAVDWAEDWRKST
eukprot:512313-Amphidinium_carterae.1